MNRRELNQSIFEDTRKLCETHPRLLKSIKLSIAGQVMIPEKQTLTELDLHRYEEKGYLTVTKHRTFEAASHYTTHGFQTAVLNFASASNPGGGVINGSSAQEESLCRCSTLYFCLNTPKMWDSFYTPHRRERDPLHKDDCIYTPGVMVFKSDTDAPKLLPERIWYEINVLTCAAPNLRPQPSNRMNPGDGSFAVKISDEALKALHVKRLHRILNIAAANGNEAVVLGAFGCGAFMNDPQIVAAAAKEVVQDYRYAFRAIEFAVYCRPGDDRNYRCFLDQLQG